MIEHASSIPQRLVVFEMANNHMGDLAHGIHVIEQFSAVARRFPDFSFAFKLQYRDLDTFIHPAKQGRMDIPYVKRFSDTRLTRAQFDQLVDVIRDNGFLAMATPFDNASLNMMTKQKLDIAKIASCSFTDWPLLEDVVKLDCPIIASTAGASSDEIDQVISFLDHRKKDFAILHCVGEYPTPDEKMNLNQIDYLRNRYPGVRIGFSTHEAPSNYDIVKMAIAKGVTLFEKHVGVATEKYQLNAYSILPDQAEKWLEQATYAIRVCGQKDGRAADNENEVKALRSLRRGAFLKRDVLPGQVLTSDDVYFAFPPEPDQITANEWSKYARFTAAASIKKDEPVTQKNTKYQNDRAYVFSIAQNVKELLRESKITVPGGIDLEISYHYGIENFTKFGLTMLTIVNRGYCKKILVCLPGQTHPEQYHQKKEETFHILYGDLLVNLNGEVRSCKPGDVINIEPGVRHSFTSQSGAVFEEISSTHYKDDSFYTDPAIMNNKSRKTMLTYWMAD